MFLKMKLKYYKIYYVLICLVIFVRELKTESERLPNPLEDEDYETFKNILENGGERIKGRSKKSRKFNRLLLSGKYALKDIENPLTGKFEKMIVSISILTKLVNLTYSSCFLFANLQFFPVFVLPLS